MLLLLLLMLFLVEKQNCFPLFFSLFIYLFFFLCFLFQIMLLEEEGEGLLFFGVQSRSTRNDFDQFSCDHCLSGTIVVQC